MKPAVIRTLTDTFEGHAQQTDTGVEYWLARDLQHLLGYTEWRNFQAVLVKARTACEVSGRAVSDHFVDVNKTIGMPKGATKDVADVMLTRYACYLIAQNGDPKKDEIAFALEERTAKSERGTVHPDHAGSSQLLPPRFFVQ